MSESLSIFDYSKIVKTPIFLEECTNPSQNKLFRDTIDTWHSYKKFKHSPTRNLRWLIYESVSGNLVGAVGLSSSVISVLVRDKFIGWDKETKMRGLKHIANNSRMCLIQSNMTIKNIGSMTLKQLGIIGKKRWEEKYGDELVMLETFVEPDRTVSYNGQMKRSGAIYRASNWVELGYTRGNSFRKAPLLLWKKENGERGRLARENPVAAMEKYGYGGKQYIIEKSPQKIMFVKPLIKNWRKVLLSD